MRLVHFAADGIVVSGLEGVADRKNTVFLLNDKLGAGIILGRYIALHAVEHLHCCIAKGLETETSCDTLAAFATPVVGRILKLMLHAGVNEHESVVRRVEGEIPVLHRAAVEAHQVPLAAEHRRKLIHDATVHAAIVVLGALADAGEFELVDGIIIEEVVESESEAAFEGGR